MDGNAISNIGVTLEEVVSELNNQIASLNFEITVQKLAIKKLQNALSNQSENRVIKSEEF